MAGRATQTIRRRRKLVGVDVIYAHRLLKSPVQVPEYVLMSEDLYRGGSDFLRDRPMQEVGQDLEGIGPVPTYVTTMEDLAGTLVPGEDPPLLRRLGETFGILGRGLRCQVNRRRAAVGP